MNYFVVQVLTQVIMLHFELRIIIYIFSLFYYIFGYTCVGMECLLVSEFTEYITVQFMVFQ